MINRYLYICFSAFMYMYDLVELFFCVLYFVLFSLLLISFALGVSI